ncbi:hypothetical protein Plhal304r1_c013g0048931 [Plasmopara halstedii]
MVRAADAKYPGSVQALEALIDESRQGIAVLIQSRCNAPILSYSHERRDRQRLFDIGYTLAVELRLVCGSSSRAL